MKPHYASLALLAAFAHPTAMPVQQTTPPAQQTTPPAQSRSALQPQRGGGRGRGSVQALTITTSAWADGGAIPGKYGQPGHDVSPPLAWSWSTANPPDNIASLVLIVHDLDAPVGNGADDLLHWLLWNIPGSARQLPEGVPQGATLPDGTRQISATGPNYRGPAAPASGPPHHYVFELFGLDTMLDVPAVGATPMQTRAAVAAAMVGHVRGKGVYIGTYRR